MDAIEPEPASSPRKRRWFKYSLRTLLAVMLLASIGMNWLAAKAKRQAEAVDAIRHLGDKTTRPAKYPSSPRFLRATVPTRGTVAYDYELASGKRPTGAEFVRNALGRDFVAGVEKATLSGPEVTDAQLEHLKALPTLKSLYLLDTQITDAGLAQLKELHQLEHLVLQGCQASDSGLEHIKGLTHLRKLELWGDQITDRGLQHLEGLIRLEDLSLGHARVTDTGLRHLAGMEQLRILTLDSSRLTDAGLEHFKGLSQLQELYFYSGGGGFTIESMRSLQRAIPKCRVYGLQ